MDKKINNIISFNPRIFYPQKVADRTETTKKKTIINRKAHEQKM